MSAFGFDPPSSSSDPIRRNRGDRPIRIRPGRGGPGRWLAIVAVVVVVLLLVAGSLLGLRVNYLFLNSMGHSNVFWTPLTTQAGLFLVGFLVTGLLVGLNVPVWRAIGRHLDPSAPRLFTWVGLAIAAVAGIVGGLALAGQWQDVLLWQHGTPFNASDPVFGKDFSFFLFTLPVIDDAQALLWGAVLVSLLAAVGLAVLSQVVEHVPPSEMSIPFKPPLGSDPRDSFALAVQQAAVALIGLFVLAGAGAHFGVYHLATSQHDGYTGLDATERNVVRPVLGFLQVLALVLAVLAALVVLARRTRPATGTAVLLGGLLGGWLLIAGLLQAVPAAIYQGTVAGPNALSAQSPTITDYLKTSRAAWGLQEGPDVSVKQFGTVQTPTLSDLAADPQTVGNVRIQDYRELPETFKQIDRSRSYQTYPTITVDRYPMTGGGEAEVMLAPREIAEGDIPNRTFVNSALLYTHGYGIIAASVNQVQPDGSPHILVGGVPPNQVKNSALPSLSSAVDAKADPRIYCGMSTTQPVIVNTTQNEFDYPSGSGDATSHAGTNMAGIPVDNPVDRFALSTSAFGSLDMFLTTAMTPESRVMLHRAISDRITTLAPFLTMDSDPYIVADPVSHHLVWIADAYVTSDRFPEAFQQDDGTSYMRNAVKAVVDARTCQTTLYMVDPNEPITHAYNDIFPGLMKPLDAMPMSIRQHLRYPEDLLKAQSSAYGSVHVNPTNPGVLFTKSDLWRVADEKLNNTQTPTQAYYVEMTLPGKTKPEFVLLQTFSPAANGGNGGSANNMTAWLAAESDYTTTNHPKLVAVPLNNGSNVLGPLQFDNNINTNPDISKQLSLLGQGGSQTVLGNVIVLPFNNHSFLYVRPLYVLAANSGGSGGSFPQLVYVIAGTNANVAMGTSLSSALQQLFATTEAIPGLAASPANPSPLPGTTGPSPGITSPTPFPTSVALTGQEEQLLNDLLQHQANAEKALNKGDLVTYAQEAAAVTKDADQLSALTGSGAAASPSPSP